MSPAFLISLPWLTFGSWGNTLFFSEQQVLSYNEVKDRLRGGSHLTALDLLTHKVPLDKMTMGNPPAQLPHLGAATHYKNWCGSQG